MKTNRLSFVGLIAVGMLLLAGQAHGQATSAPAVSGAPAVPSGPNILLITTQTLAPDALGFAGDKQARTPNLDRLAGASAQFTRCYVPTPQVAPGQAALLTGHYPHMVEVTGDGMPLSPHFDTFTGRLKRAGYRAAFVGSMTLSGGALVAPTFGLTDYVALSESPATDAQWSAAKVKVGSVESTAGKYLDDWHGDRALDAIDKVGDRPFVMWVSFRGPGDVLTFPPGSEKSFPIGDMKLGESRGIDPQLWPQKLIQSNPAARFKQTPDPQQREARAKYLAMLARVDENIGRILKRLEERKLADKTVIVFTATSGYALGDHQLMGAGPAFFEQIARVPLLVHTPKMKPLPPVENVVSLVDVCPTVCELAGLDRPVQVSGQSLAPLLEEYSRASVGVERFFEFHRQIPWTGNPEHLVATPPLYVAPTPQPAPPTPVVAAPPMVSAPPQPVIAQPNPPVAKPGNPYPPGQPTPGAAPGAAAAQPQYPVRGAPNAPNDRPVTPPSGSIMQNPMQPPRTRTRSDATIRAQERAVQQAHADPMPAPPPPPPNASLAPTGEVELPDPPPPSGTTAPAAVEDSRTVPARFVEAAPNALGEQVLAEPAPRPPQGRRGASATAPAGTTSPAHRRLEPSEVRTFSRPARISGPHDATPAVHAPASAPSTTFHPPVHRRAGAMPASMPAAGVAGTQPASGHVTTHAPPAMREPGMPANGASPPAAGIAAPPPAPAVPPPVDVRVRGLVTAQFKYIDYLDDQDVLYDLKRDPGETHNVINELQYKAVVKVLGDRLREWRRATRDPWPAQ